MGGGQRPAARTVGGGRMMVEASTCVAFPATEPPFPEALAVAERIEAGVFRATYGESAEDLGCYYAEHLLQTQIVLVRDGGWAGMMRLGLPGPRTSLSLEDAEAQPFGADVGADLAGEEPVVLLDVLTAAVRSRFRNRRIFERMLDAAARVAREHGCTHLVAMVDRRVLVYLRRRRLHYTLHTGLHDYHGSPATGFVSVETGELRRWLGQAA